MPLPRFPGLLFTECLFGRGVTVTDGGQKTKQGHQVIWRDVCAPGAPVSPESWALGAVDGELLDGFAALVGQRLDVASDDGLAFWYMAPRMPAPLQYGDAHHAIEHAALAVTPIMSGPNNNFLPFLSTMRGLHS